MRLKRIFSCLLIFTLGCSLFITANASTSSAEIKPSVNQSEFVCESVITDKEMLEEIVVTDNINVPDGYHLEKVEIYSVFLDDSNIATSESDEVTPYGIIYEIKNLEDKGSGYYFSSEYDSDIFEGPCNVTETYSRTSTVKKDVSVSITNAALKAGLGYSVTDSYTKSSNFNTTVAAGKKLEVRIHTNYQKHVFDIYNKLTGVCAETDACTYKPVGLYFKQYTYSL